VHANTIGNADITCVRVLYNETVHVQCWHTTDLHQAMQNGSFDVPDRLFSSIPRAWHLCTSALSEVKELTPEWYSTAEFLKNANGFDLGTTQDGEIVNNVVLPKWANTAEDFIIKHR
jgi:Beige/BEACH domain